MGGAPGDPDALWVLEQPGRADPPPWRAPPHAARPHATRPRSAPSRACSASRSTLISPRTSRLFLHWSDKRGDTRVGEFRDGKLVRELLHVDQPEENHNGGQLAFGLDGRLYLGLGDGGGAFDPSEHAQNPRSKLGKLLSVDVEAPRADWRVALTGLRNPWRFAFDPALGEVWIGDVGQDEVEEVNRVLLEPDEPPKNLGWDAFEGDRPTEGDDFALDRTGDLVWPVAAYTHQDGCSVIGGYVYHGTALEACRGATSTATSAAARCGRSTARRRAAPTTSAASARRCSSSPTSARTPTASPCSRPRPARSIAPFPPRR